MNNPKWWDIAVAGTAVIVGITVVYTTGGYEGWAAFVSLVMLCLVYYLFGRRLVGATDRVPPPTSMAPSITFQALLAIIVAVGAAFEPNVVTAQAIAFPLIWVVSLNTRQAVIANIFAAIVIAVGFGIGLGGATGAIQALFVAGLSLAFSLALGLWITSIANYAEERDRLLAELRATQGELEGMSRIAGATAERERIAREIHDTIAQSLTSIVMLAQRARLEQPTPETALELIESTARDALGEARALVTANAGLPSTDASLAETLSRLGERFSRETSVAVTTHVTLSGLPRDIEVVLLRCAQEGLANVRKHAAARTASVTVSSTESSVTLEIRDDGRGLRGYTPGDERGFGLSGMRDRVGLVGGTLTVTDADTASGTILTVDIPLMKAHTA
ncbi:sensor histidine kinase [Mycetocola zhadangensis]|uniref:histidine kinase n=1 Tax=Mycetocola zhadangensis TaxID=1164595 RepID=A0A3L7J0U0_9MICO|nr:sensor histidine kinase [Mycetocola zhadangensis]RLQ83979.1 sensor histidine kinase [Mycetocola zhadangensis]GGE97160.1 two-component sensor histidine kinase [Mycetocola zhadangensis]